MRGCGGPCTAHAVAPTHAEASVVMAETRGRATNPWRELERLLEESWTDFELRQWVHHEYPEIAGELPGGNASRSELVWHLVDLLHRRRLANEDFFERVLAARPGRRVEILAVRSGVLAATGRAASRPPAWGGRRYPELESPWSPRARLFGYLAGACAVLWLIAILYSGGQVAALQKALFSFSPVNYQRFGFLGASGLSLATSRLCRLFARMESATRS